MSQLLTNPANPQSYKCLIAGLYAGQPLAVPPFALGADNTTADYLRTRHPLGKVPVLVCPDGAALFEANAIARYLSRGTPLYGKTPFEAAQVDQWVDFAQEIELPGSAWLVALNPATACPAGLKRAKSDVRKAMGVLNTHLATRTFFVGERVSLADIALACALLDLYRLVLDPGFRKEFKNLNRWFNTMVHQPNVKTVVGEVQLCAKAPQEPKEQQQPKKEEKKEEKPQPKKEEKKPKAPAKKEEDMDEEEEEEGEEKKEKKAPNPLDLLPPSKFLMDNWKRVYSNEDTATVAVPWFWENYDPEGFSLWFCNFKFPIEAEQVFMVCNSIGGFIQRLDPLRKYGFGTLCIFNETKPFEIHGVFLFRGKDVPKEMKDCDDYELYEWKPVDLNDPAQKQLVTDFLLWEGAFGGWKFNQGKIFK